MFNDHFNERAQVHRLYNCLNLLLRVSAFVFLVDTFATYGTSEAKVIRIRMKQIVRWRDKIAALTNESRRQGVHFSNYTHTSKQTLTFLES